MLLSSPACYPAPSHRIPHFPPFPFPMYCMPDHATHSHFPRSVVLPFVSCSCGNRARPAAFVRRNVAIRLVKLLHKRGGRRGVRVGRPARGRALGAAHQPGRAATRRGRRRGPDGNCGDARRTRAPRSTPRTWRSARALIVTGPRPLNCHLFLTRALFRFLCHFPGRGMPAPRWRQQQGDCRRHPPALPRSAAAAHIALPLVLHGN